MNQRTISGRLQSPEHVYIAPVPEATRIPSGGSTAPVLLTLDGLKCSSHVGDVDVVCP